MSRIIFELALLAAVAALSQAAVAADMANGETAGQTLVCGLPCRGRRPEKRQYASRAILGHC